MSAHLPIYVGATAAAAWLYLLLGHGRFWQVRVRGASGKPKVNVVAVVPARNEAEFIGVAVCSLLEQQGVDVRVIVVDDNSSDGTAELARQAAGSTDRLHVVEGAPLRPGWSGKVWAMQQGVEAAQALSPDFYLFTDADVEHDAGNLAQLVGIAEEGGYDLTSFMVKLHCQSVAEKLLIPAFVFFFFKLYPPARIANPHSSTAGAAGGCLLIRPEALARAGGLDAIQGEIIDDCSLARAVKRTGGKLWLGVTETAHSIRPYRSFGEIGRMISRTAFNQLGHSSIMLLAAVFGLLLVYVSPFAVLLSSSPVAAGLGWFALALMMAAYFSMVRFHRLNFLWTLTLPLAAIFYIGATIHSAVSYWLGRGGVWKGRTQDRETLDAR